MKADDFYIIFLGLAVIGGALWVRFGIGSDSWTNWLMAGVGALLIGWRVVVWLHRRTPQR